MSVVEKESPIDEGTESAQVEPGSPLKVSRAIVAGMGAASATNGKHSRPVLYREPRGATPAEIRAFVATRSDALQQFVAPLEEALRKAAKLRVRPVSATRRAVLKVSELVLGVIRRIAHRETGVYSMEPNVALLLSSLCAGSVEGAIVSGLVRRAQQVQDAAGIEAVESASQRLAAAPGPLSEYDVGRELDELTMLLKWYVKRKASLTGLEVHHSRKADLASDAVLLSGEEDNAIFSFEVMHDHQVFASKGCFVSCGLRLVGHDGQPLWLRVSVRASGEPVRARPGWSSWTDPGGEGVASDDTQFCSLVPIRPNAQRLIIDDIRAFVPYAALDLPPGRSDIQLYVAVIDDDGREILSAAKPESICVPPREALASGVPAPHSIGMWPHDVVSGDRISDLRVASGHKVVAGWERHTVSAQFDLSLFMHAGESVLLECRFVDSKGNVVELSSLGIPYVAAELGGAVESVSSYRYRRVLHPRGAWAVYRGLCVDIPVEFLLLEPGTHSLTCEVVVVSSDDRILCGDIGLVTVQVPGRIAAAADEGERAKDVGIELRTLEVDPAWVFAGEESVRVEAVFAPTNTSRHIADLASGRVGELFKPYRVEISIEREDGHLLLQAFSDPLGMGFKPVTRGVCVESSSGFSSHAIAANFGKDEILGWSLSPDGGRGLQKVALVARVRVLSLTGEELVAQSRDFFIKPPSGNEPKVVDVGAPMPCVTDAVASLIPQTSRIACSVAVNIPRGRALEQGLQLSCALHAAGKKPVEVFRRNLGSAQRAAWARQQVGLGHTLCEFECDAASESADALTLTVSLLSASGEPISSVRQPVRLASVLLGSGSSPDGMGADSEVHDQAASEAQRSSRRSIFSWFKS
jgi:hypothetical protein